MYCLLYYRRFPLLCIKRDAPCQLQINWHFHFLNFPTSSSLLHIREILVHWPFLEISGPQKWVVGATLALKHNFLAGTLNASYKQWVGILLMPNIDRAHKNYLTPKIWEKTQLREIIYGTLVFQQSILLPSNIETKTTFCLYLVKHFDSYAQMCCKHYHIIFSTSSLKFRRKSCVQKEEIHNFKNQILVKWPATNLLILGKWYGFEKPNHYYFV